MRRINQKNMFSEKDKQFIENRGSEIQNVLSQIENFKTGFPYLEIEAAASVGNGIIRLNQENLEKRCELYEEKLSEKLIPLKFIPASGAASRMFKALFEGLEDLENNKSIENNKAASEYVTRFEEFAFADELKSKIQQDGAEINPKNLIDYLLNDKGLNYGSLPKALLKS